MVKDLCFEIIESCLDECKFCSSNSCIGKNKIISFEDFKRVIDYFMNNGGISELSISGGEPFLHPSLFDMVSYAKSLGIKTFIYTSGVKKRGPLTEEVKTYYTSEMHDKLAEIEQYEPWNEKLKMRVKNFYENILNPKEEGSITKDEFIILKELGLDKIVFDFQSYSHEADEYLMGRNREKYKCMLDSLFNASLANIDIDIHYIPMKPNYKELPDIIEMLEILGIKKLSILNFVPQGRALKNRDALELSSEEMEEFKKILVRCQKRFSGTIRTSIPLMEESTHKCNAGLEKLDIKFDGTILPCAAFKEMSLEDAKRLGIKLYNIYDSLEEVSLPGGTRVKPLCRTFYQNKKGE